MLCRCTYIAYYSWNKIIILHTHCQVNCIVIQHIHRIPYSLIYICSVQSLCLFQQVPCRNHRLSPSWPPQARFQDRNKLHKWSKVDQQIDTVICYSTSDTPSTSGLFEHRPWPLTWRHQGAPLPHTAATYRKAIYPGDKPRPQQSLAQHWDPYVSLFNTEMTLSIDGQKRQPIISGCSMALHCVD